MVKVKKCVHKSRAFTVLASLAIRASGLGGRCFEQAANNGKLSKRFALIAALVLSVLAFAKEKDKKNNPDVKFTARTELVLIPTLVTDKSGNHIPGLKKED